MRKEAPAFCMPPPGFEVFGSDDKIDALTSPWSQSTEAPSPIFAGSMRASPVVSPLGIGDETLGDDSPLWLPLSACTPFSDPQHDTDWISSVPPLATPDEVLLEDAGSSNSPQEGDNCRITEFKLTGTEDLQHALVDFLAGLSAKPRSSSFNDAESTNAATDDDDASSDPSTPADEETAPCRWSLPQTKNAEEESAAEEIKRTTVSLQNVPKKFTRDMLSKALNEAGFRGDYKLLYVMADLQQRNSGTGQALVDFRSEEACERFITVFHKKSANLLLAGVGGKKAIEATHAPTQGTEANVRKLQKSTLLMSFLAERPGWLPAQYDSDGKIEAEINEN
jgi:hypothetical protein